MFWVALSAFIMAITGKGDDTFVFRKSVERTRHAVASEVHDPARRQKATATLERVWNAFFQYRQRVNKISSCLEKADRRYSASATDYQRCLADARPVLDSATRELVALDREFQRALTPAEYAAVCRSAQQ